MAAIDTIDRDDLKAKLDRGDDFVLLMTHNDHAFETAHIPGSTHFHPLEHSPADLPQDRSTEVVVYCTDEACIASQAVYHNMVAEGYSAVRRYAGGIADWVAAGYEVATGR